MKGAPAAVIRQMPLWSIDTNLPEKRAAATSTLYRCMAGALGCYGWRG